MALPTNYDTVPVTGTWVNLDGSPASGQISFTANVPSGTFLTDSGANVLILPMTITAKLDSQGSVSVSLPATDDPDISPAGFTYTVTEKLSTGSRSYSIAVPSALASTGVDLVTVAPTAPVAASATLVKSVNGVKPDNTGNITIAAGSGGAVSSVNSKTGAVTLSASDVSAMPNTGGTISGIVNINATGSTENPATTPYGYGNSTAPTGLLLQSAYPSDDIAGGTDGTSRVILESYQRANAYGFGEIERIILKRKDAKGMVAWYAPSAGYDGTTRDPTAGTGWQPVTWIGSHVESNGHTGNHNHWEIEIPDSNGALQGRFEILFMDQSLDNKIGLDKTMIATNLADFVVRAHGTNTVTGADIQQALIICANAGWEKPIVFANDTAGAQPRFKVKVTNDAESTGNVGSHFAIERYDDTGTLIDVPFKINRTTGQILLAQGVSVTSPTTAAVFTRSTNGTVVQGSITASGATSSVYTAVAPSTAKAFQAQQSADTSARYSVDVNGRIEWGSGAATRDTFLYRNGAGILKTDGAIAIGGNVGFYGTTPTTKPTVTGSKSGGAALTSLISALVSLGLITDTTTA